MASAQFGFRVKYNTNSFPNWEEYIPEVNKNNLELGFDYWFKLKNQRVEFTPEVFYGMKSEVLYTINIGRELSFTHQYIGLQLNTQFYILDFEGDCDCPTFSKEGPSIKKGFFVNFAPALLYNKYERTTEIIDFNPETSNMNLRVAIGAGIDVGITDLLTITPFVNYTWSPSNDSDIYDSSNEKIVSNWTNIQFGLRFGFRPDYVKKYGYR